MSNPAYSRVKIGKSAQDPTKYRAKELYQTGVPEPMKVEYSALVEDEDLLERLVHQRFHASRPNKGREFFDLDVPTAIKGIRELAAERSPIRIEDVYYDSHDDWDEELLDLDTGNEEHDLVAAENKKKPSISRWHVVRSIFRYFFIAVSFFMVAGLLMQAVTKTVGHEAAATFVFPIIVVAFLICVLFFWRKSGLKKLNSPASNKGRNAIYIFWYVVLVLSSIPSASMADLGVGVYLVRLFVVPAMSWVIFWFIIRAVNWYTKRPK